MVAKLLRYPFGAATLAECPDSHGNRLPDFLGTGMVTALQCGHEQGIGPNDANTEVVHCCPHHEPPRLLVPLTTSPGPGTLDLYLAEHPGRLVIPASRKNASGPTTHGAHPRSLRLDLLAEAWEVARPPAVEGLQGGGGDAGGVEGADHGHAAGGADLAQRVHQAGGHPGAGRLHRRKLCRAVLESP
jgi:hypothetical protein